MKKVSRLKKNINKILPTDIISDILTRLPAESVLESKSVCKTWNNLIHHPSFPQMHLTRLHHPDSGKLRYVFSHPDEDDDDYDRNRHLYYFEFNENEDWNYVTPTYKKIMFEVFCEAYIVIGSINGLICIYGTQPSLPDILGPAVILNPVTKEYVLLPEFDSIPEYETKGVESSECYHVACGFGYLAETNDYKVVRIYMYAETPNVIEVEVYTVGSGKGWRHVGKFNFGFRFYTYCEHTHGVFLNECLHWRNIQGGMVVVFDLADEKFRDHIPPPPMLTEGVDVNDTYGFIVIGVSGGGILYYAVCQIFEDREFDDVWLLMNKNNNHVVKEQHQLWGWTKVSSLEQKEPFAFMEGGDVLRYDQGNIKILSSTTSTWIPLVNFSDMSRQVFPHKHTLISLKQLGEEEAKIMKGIDETDSSDSGSD